MGNRFLSVFSGVVSWNGCVDMHVLLWRRRFVTRRPALGWCFEWKTKYIRSVDDENIFRISIFHIHFYKRDAGDNDTSLSQPNLRSFKNLSFTLNLKTERKGPTPGGPRGLARQMCRAHWLNTRPPASVPLQRILIALAVLSEKSEIPHLTPYKKPK